MRLYVLYIDKRFKVQSFSLRQMQFFYTFRQFVKIFQMIQIQSFGNLSPHNINLLKILRKLNFQKKEFYSSNFYSHVSQPYRFVWCTVKHVCDPDPERFRIQRVIGFGPGFKIRIRIQVLKLPTNLGKLWKNILKNDLLWLFFFQEKNTTGTLSELQKIKNW